ncbi:MAG: ATP-binding protein, partial [Ferruginibacter sp.]
EQFGDESWVKIIHPDDVEATLEKYQHCVKTGENFSIEYRFKDRKTGSYRWFLGKAQTIKDAENNVIKWFGSSTDIEAQKSFSEKLEENVNERTLELKKVNVELENFAYVASHDLQEPLRKIQTYSARILDKEDTNLSDNGKEYFRRLQRSAKRMQNLINDLLEYSRTNNTASRFEKVDLNLLLKDVINDFKETILAQGALIENGGLCEAELIPYQFRQVLQNLVSNSLKFAKAGVTPQITLSSQIKMGSQLLPSLVRDEIYCHMKFVDNGIGFEPQYKDRIFEMFQRLNGRTEFEGTGIGLAIVNKIIENHKGLITATSELGEGATFDVYIPQRTYHHISTNA